jgi:cytochrome c oxidase subunit 2
MKYLFALIALFFVPQQLFAQDVAQGKTLYTTCAACHGANGEGVKATNAPSLAGQEPWYLLRQLKNFKEGIRGTHAQDTYGTQMRPMAMMLVDEKAMQNVVAYIQTFKKVKNEATKGDLKAGAASYATCTACHGAKGEGNQALNAPKLTNLPGYYLERQLKNFKAGIRGSHPQDQYGLQMKGMSMTLVDDKAIENVVAYIRSLDK